MAKVKTIKFFLFYFFAVKMPLQKLDYYLQNEILQLLFLKIQQCVVFIRRCYFVNFNATYLLRSSANASMT